MSVDLLLLTLLLAIGISLLAIGVLVKDQQVRVRWGNWVLPEARVPRVKERVRQDNEESPARKQFRAVFPLPTDAGAEPTEWGSRAVRRFG